jgi:hypothetical protein
MDRKQFLEKLRQGRADWDRLLAQVPGDQMTRSGVTEAWTMKDLIAHVSWYEREMVGLLDGRTMLKAADLWGLSGDERNLAIYEQNKDRPLNEVREEARNVSETLLHLVAALSDEELVEPSRFEGMPDDWVPWRVIADNTYEHYENHMPDIWAWLAGKTLTFARKHTENAHDDSE